MGRLVYITYVTLDVPRGGTTGKLLVCQEKSMSHGCHHRYRGCSRCHRMDMLCVFAIATRYKIQAHLPTQLRCQCERAYSPVFDLVADATLNLASCSC